MRIPPDALVPHDKLTGYLLAPRPKNDKSQFLARAGFTLDNPHDLEAAIRRLIRSADAVWEKSSEYGDFYRVDGELVGSTGQIMVTTVWIIQTDLDNQFRFVTLKPRRKTHDET